MSYCVSRFIALCVLLCWSISVRAEPITLTCYFLHEINGKWERSTDYPWKLVVNLDESEIAFGPFPYKITAVTDKFITAQDNWRQYEDVGRTTLVLDRITGDVYEVFIHIGCMKVTVNNPCIGPVLTSGTNRARCNRKVL